MAYNGSLKLPDFPLNIALSTHNTGPDQAGYYALKFISNTIHFSPKALSQAPILWHQSSEGKFSHHCLHLEQLI